MVSSRLIHGSFKAVIFDLYSALLDSWSLWNRMAGDVDKGLTWRREYIRMTYAEGAYRDYTSMIREAARITGIPVHVADRLIDSWGELQPWPETTTVLSGLSGKVSLGVVTNSSDALAKVALERIGVELDGHVTAEEAGYFKPHPAPYLMALKKMGTCAGQTLFVAGSPADIPGASAVGMPVYWHNRMHLDPLTDPGKPVIEKDALHPLLQIIA